MNHLTIKSLLYLIAVQRAKHVIFVSESCLEQFRFSRLISKKTTILRNVIHKGRIERLLELDKNDYGLDFVFMGRIVHQKNPVRVAKVASSILKRCESSRFGVIGGGELSKEMEQIFEQEGVSDRVVFTGRLEYPYKALKDARCLLLCSFFEGTPIAALEALSLGVPVVSTPVDGLKSIIRDHENGYLSEDDEELSNFIQQILTNDDAFNELRKRTLHNFFSINDEYSYAHKLNDIYLLCFGL
jgi:glycosyltransferase involved in cell wall biosynthesis